MAQQQPAIVLAENAIVRHALSSMIGVAWHWDLASDEFDCSVLGHYTVEPVRSSQSFFDALLPEDLAELKRAVQTALACDGVLDIQVKAQVNDGFQSFRLLGSQPRHNDTKHFAGVMIPASPAQQTLQDVLNNLPIMVYLKDLAGRYLYANQAYLDVCGISLACLVGRRHEDAFTDSLPEPIQTAFQKVLQSKAAVDVSQPLPLSNSDNSYFLKLFPILDGQSHLRCVGVTLLDKSESHDAKSAIASERLRQTQVLDSVRSLIWYLDVQGRIQYMNKNALKLLAQPFEAFHNKTLVESLSGWDAATSLQNGVLEVATTGKPILDVVFRYDQNGKEYWTKVDRIPVKDAAGVTENVMMVVTDITKLRKNEQKLARHNARNRAIIATSFEAIFCLAFDPPIPLSDSQERRVEKMLSSGYFLDCNEKFAAQHGRDVTQVIEHRITQVHDDRGNALKVLEEFAKHNFVAENLIIALNHEGKERWWEYTFKCNTRDNYVVELWGTSRDVTDVKREAMVLQQNEARYRSFIANSHEGIFHAELPEPIPLSEIDDESVATIATELVVTECNDEYARQFGFASRSECEGLHLYDVESATFVVKKVREFVRNGYQLVRHILRVSREGKSETWLSISMEGVIANGCLTGCWGTQRDITEREQYLQRLEYQANHDSLTGLPNRQKLYTELHHRLQITAPGRELALILIDLDHFKEINDTLGHHIGDMLLKELGPRLQEAIKGYDGLVARLGGDEFAVMLAGVTEKVAAQVAYELLGVLSTSFNLQGFQAEVAASIGLAYSPRHASDVAGLMRYADIAMYQAKTESLGVVEYNPNLDTHTPRRLALMTDLGKAIREDQLCLYFQPKIDLGGRFIRGFEALLRWNHPEHGFLPPGEFIGLAEASEVIRPLTLWVLDAALAQCRRWREQKLEAKVAVNLSTRNLLDDNIVVQVEAALNRHQVPAKALELEITESTIMADPKRAAIALQKISELGVHLSVDDFGTGYSSLAYLKSLPVDTLKIDYSFVKDMLVEQQDAIIVSSTINLAHNLGLKVVAEGVESAEILEALDRMGCDLAQGYFIAKPMPANEVVKWINGVEWSTIHLQSD